LSARVVGPRCGRAAQHALQDDAEPRRGRHLPSAAHAHSRRRTRRVAVATEEKRAPQQVQ